MAKSLIYSIADVLFGGDDEEEAAEYTKKKAKSDAKKGFVYKGFIKAYGKALKDVPKEKHKQTPLQDFHKDVRGVLQEYDHINDEKIKYTRNNILQDNLGVMSRLGPRSQGLVMSELDSRFRIGNQEVQEDPATQIRPMPIGG